MTGPENHELERLGYVIKPHPEGFELTLNGKVLCRSVVDGNCWAVGRHHARAALLGPKELRTFERGLRR